MPSIPIILPAHTAPTELTTLVALVYDSSTNALVATVTMAELPESSTRYVGAFASPAVAASYDVSIVDADANQYGTLGVETDSDGSEITLANISSGGGTVTFEQAAAAVGVPAPTSGAISVLRGDTISVALTDLGDLSARTQLWMTVKGAGTYQIDPDTKSLVQIEETGGLIRVASSAYTPSTDGSLVVTDPTTGAVVITIEPQASSLLSPGTDYVYDIQMRTSSAGIKTLAFGAWCVFPDVTAAV